MTQSKASPILTDSDNYLSCPFCENRRIEPIRGKTRCPDCKACFEVDDRCECIFVSTESLRLPIKGSVCRSCGLIQADESLNCLYCGVEICGTVQ